MKATKYIKKYGWDKAQKVVEYRDLHAKDCHTYIFTGGGAYSTSHSYTTDGLNVNVDDLAKILASNKLVLLLDNLEEAKQILFNAPDDAIGYHITYENYFYESNAHHYEDLNKLLLEDLKHAIQDVEDCQPSNSSC